MSVCPLAVFTKTTQLQYFTKFSVRVNCVGGSVLVWR